VKSNQFSVGKRTKSGKASIDNTGHKFKEDVPIDIKNPYKALKNALEFFGIQVCFPNNITIYIP